MTKSPKTTTAPTGQIAPFGLRMLPELREKVEQAARDSGRSMNAEIVTRLEKSFDNDSSSGGLITLSMDEFDTVIEAAISKALDRSKKATNR